MQIWLTILGAILAIGGGFLEKAYARRKERQSLRAGLQAEIRAILAIVQRRNYIAGITAFIEAIGNGSTSLFEARVSTDYNVVFKSNCDKLGLLPSDLAARTVTFYYLVSSVAEDLDLLRDASESASLRSRYGLHTQAGNLAFHQQLRQLSIETLTLGNEIIPQLSANERAVRRSDAESNEA